MPQKRKNRKLCFVIMPFSPTPTCKNWDNIFDNFFKPAINGSGFGYYCERSNILGGPFIKDILQKLYTADIVLADLTDRNPNVFYELGVRHTFSNRTILVTQNLEQVPSDLAGYGVIEYSPSIDGLRKFRQAIRKMLRTIEKNPDRNDSPVSEYIKNRNYLIFDYEKDFVLRRLSALHSELFDNATTIIKNKQHYDELKEPIYGVFVRCVEDILTSQYVDLDLETHGLLKELVLHLQKLDYFAKLLTAPHKEMREAHKDIYFAHMDAALAIIFRVKVKIQQLIKDIYSNNYRLEKREPIMRSVFWEISQEDIEKWIEDQKKKSKNTTG